MDQFDIIVTQYVTLFSNIADAIHQLSRDVALTDICSSDGNINQLLINQQKVFIKHQQNRDWLMVRVFVKCHLLPQSLCLDMFTKPTLLKKNCAYHILILTITLNNATSNSQLKKIGCIWITNTNTLRLKSYHDKFHFCLWFKIGN